MVSQIIRCINTSGFFTKLIRGVVPEVDPHQEVFKEGTITDRVVVQETEVHGTTTLQCCGFY